MGAADCRVTRNARRCVGLLVVWVVVQGATPELGLGGGGGDLSLTLTRGPVVCVCGVLDGGEGRGEGLRCACWSLSLFSPLLALCRLAPKTGTTGDL